MFNNIFCEIKGKKVIHWGPKVSWGAGFEKVPISSWLVTLAHLWSYTNTAITDNSAPISPVTPRDIRAPTSPHRAPSSPHRAPISSIEWRLFHDVSQCFKSVSWCFTSGSYFTSGSWCFTSGSWCFTMYHNVLHVLQDVLLCLTIFYDA